MISLIYASSAPRLIRHEDLIAILKKAREKNERLGITGMLLYKNGNFLQVLEGPEKEVQEVFDTIMQDTRHNKVLLILKRTISKRDFSEWQMGFVNLNNPNLKDMPGYSRFLHESLDAEKFTQNPSFAHEFLLAFREGIR